MPKPVGNSSRYMPGLDGLRAVAVLAVIAYHLNLKAVPGGLLGVSMFFVLSGYLITDILLKQLGQNKAIDLKAFFIRRARRLLPAMFLMIALVSLWLVVSDSSRLFALRGDIGSALLYISNWWLIFHEISYFESFGPASPFGHLWSLAVEEQFYLVWPLLLIAAIRFVPKRGQFALWTLAAAALSAGAMAMLYQPGIDPSRVYYGTDTRAFALLIGAALAVVWPSWKLSTTISQRSRILLDSVGTAGMTVIAVMIATTGEYDAFLYRGGMVLLAIATAAVVAAMAHPASKLASVIGSKSLAWIGVRSYGIYLYHYPIIVLTTPTAEAGELHLARAFMQAVLTFVLAELSWRFVEEPIRHGAIGRLFRSLKECFQIPHLRKSTSYFVGIVLIVSCVSCASSVNLQSAAVQADSGSATNHPAVTIETTPTPHNPAEPDAAGKPDKIEDTLQTKPDETGGKPVAVVAKPTTPTATAAPAPGAKPDASHPIAEITAIGDSVLLDAGPYLEKLLPGIAIDGKVGRQFSQAVAILEKLKRGDELADTVIIELGTNGSFTTKQMAALLDTIGPKRKIFMINTRVPRKWQDTVNKMLAETAKANENVTIVDWYSASKGKKDFFSTDGVHLKKHGASFYADMVAKALKREEV
ncbi:peptidoglycan/LPS O-acetylase OafA/YrhL [Paenibacillus endophyticus]|uniref:Peptidoglycan/LPS O-acetylase OafA/YrhL n=1 Tax=Paenibacillus endophyticus TaxID=1294268 RepID=A0A7W5C7V9_9BACL|nr:acyltransferase family protein [Paenibacillus endophyticus]MBB3152761.1 peptidoglycan/LPS O-acetylase OafA/YrhL [Paenibacillus endophyticus]